MMEQNDGSSHLDSSLSNNSDRNIVISTHSHHSSGGTRRHSSSNNVDATPHSSFSSSQEIVPTIRRGSIASTGTITSSVSSNVVILQQQNPHQLQAAHLTMTPSEDEQDERRRNIKAIMKDPTLSQKEKSRKIQSLMDGRGQMNNQNGSAHAAMNRRGSMSSYCSNASSVYASSMAQVAADAACETSIYLDHSNHNNNTNNFVDASYHTNRSYSYSSSTQNNTDCDFVTNNNNNLAINEQKQPSDPMGSYRQYHGRSKSLQDWTDSDRINAAAHTTVFGNRIQQVSRLMEQSRPACEHYERNCTVISPCCGLAFGCRICHDECPVLPPPIVFQRRLSANAAVAPHATNTDHHTTHSDHQCGAPSRIVSNSRDHNHYIRNNDVSSMTAIADAGATSNDDEVEPQQIQQQQPHGGVHHLNKLERRRSLPLEFTTERKPEDNHHLIDRFRIREVICRHCYTRQGSKTNKCISCSMQFGQYHCDICNLWMSDVESPYHCEDCGFCRVGGRDNFRHCNDCGMCIDTLLFNDHNCKSGKYMSDCPICQEDLFSSRFASHEMPCGHAIHWHCFTELTSYDTRCPVCKKTVESPERMEATWNAIAMGIALQPVPPEMARMVNILCSDCESTNYNQRWHFLGVRCQNCYSFNTTVEQIVMQGQEAAAYLDRIDHANVQRMGDVPTDISLPMRYVAAQNDQYDMNDESSNDTMSEEDDMEE